MNETTIPTRIEGNANYPYKAGLLEGFIMQLANQNLPGIEFKSGAERLEFDKYLERELVRMHNEAVRYNS
jgi:hypothetical protein